MTDWRLGIDLGTNSLGWAALALAPDGDRWLPNGILAAGSRIFGSSPQGAGRDPKSGASLAVDRRDARAMRRRRDRFQQRQRALMAHLVADGLFPSDPAERRKLEVLDPYELRARALDKALTLPELGRAIWHLNQRRGFKSNRKTDKPDRPGDESGKIRKGVGRLEGQIAEAERAAGAEPDSWTFGKWLHMLRQPSPDHPDGRTVRARLRPEPGEDAKGMGYDFYPGRALLEHEFNTIWAAQASHHPDVLTPEVHDRLFEIVFRQRPLKQPQIGTCTFGSGESRLAKARPLFQRRRLLEEVNALMVVRTGQRSARLTPEERDAILLIKPDAKAKISFDKMRKALKLDQEVKFNKESENRDGILGDEVAVIMGAKTRFAERWVHLTPDEQWAVVERLETVQTDAELDAFRAWLIERYDLTPERAVAVAAARLPQGYGRFGERVTRDLIDALQHERTPAGRTPDAPPIEPGKVIVYSEAVAALGLHHSDLRDGVDHRGKLPLYPEVLERHLLPGSGDASEPDVFKRIGRLTNPTVHIGLNQLHRTVNKLIERFGPPREIAIELARELKLTDEEKKKRNRENNENRLAADRRGKILEENEIENNGENRAKLRLWEELDQNAMGRQCVYSGEVIGIRRLFSPEVEVDHILPFAATLDDSNGNKIVCVREANRLKRKRSPFEAAEDLHRRFGDQASWDQIAARAARLLRNKRWRFEPDALRKATEERDFLPRQLVDTQYLARLAREYLTSLYPERGEGSSNVWVSPGRMTAMVRRKLGLDRGIITNDNLVGSDADKNRLDHRHHAIDALVIAVIDRSMLQRIAHASGSQGDEGLDRIIIPEPWEGFREEARTVVRAITVSHRVDHGTAGHGTGSTAGRLHNDTAYGLTGQTDPKGTPIVVRRKPLDTLTPADIPSVRDPDLRVAMQRAVEAGRPLASVATLGPTQFRNTSRVRVTEPLSVIPIRDRQGRAYKAYKGDSNYRYDIWEMPDGKWRAQVVSMFEAHQPGERERPHPAAKRVMSLFRDDILAIERANGERELVRIVKFSDKQFAVAPPQEAGALKARDADKGDPFKYIYPSPNTLKAWRARKVGVDEIGRVRDPGFPARTAVRRTRAKMVG